MPAGSDAALMKLAEMLAELRAEQRETNRLLTRLVEREEEEEDDEEFEDEETGETPNGEQPVSEDGQGMLNSIFDSLVGNEALAKRIGGALLKRKAAVVKPSE